MMGWTEIAGLAFAAALIIPNSLVMTNESLTIRRKRRGVERKGYITPRKYRRRMETRSGMEEYEQSPKSGNKKKKGVDSWV